MAYTWKKSRTNSFALPIAPETLAQGLGWFSIALGLTEVLAPRTLARTLGMGRRKMLVAGYGVREIATGIGIFASADPTPWMWGRVSGDALDIGTLAAALIGGNPRKGSVAVALATVAGVTALDVICAQALGTGNGVSRTMAPAALLRNTRRGS